MVSMALSCIDTLGVILSDCRNTLSENWKCMIYSFVESAREVAKLTKILFSVCTKFSLATGRLFELGLAERHH